MSFLIHRLAYPRGSITYQRHSHLFNRDKRGNRLQCRRACIGILDLMPAYELHNSVVPQKVEPEPLSLVVFAFSTFDVPSG